MKKVKMEITIERYIAYADLSTEIKGKIQGRHHEIQRGKESINTTYIKALKHGLEHLTESVELTIIVPPGYLYSSLQVLEKWNENGYITGKGKKVKYADEWQEIQNMLSECIYKVEIKEKDKKEKNDGKTERVEQ